MTMTMTDTAQLLDMYIDFMMDGGDDADAYRLSPVEPVPVPSMEGVMRSHGRNMEAMKFVPVPMSVPVHVAACSTPPLYPTPPPKSTHRKGVTKRRPSTMEVLRKENERLKMEVLRLQGILYSTCT